MWFPLSLSLSLVHPLHCFWTLSCSSEQEQTYRREKERSSEIMAPPNLYFRLFTFLTFLTLLALSVEDEVKPAAAAVAVPSSKAKQFLTSLQRPKRNLWDRSRPDVQQWIQQFMYMGYDEARLETDLAYWMDQARGSDPARQHHYDENSPMGPRYASHYRHGADVNYDYY
uniref:ECRG4 augurin precursor a n=1 Tax=Astyanax mexicanus TaxID=7994 RepID=A0A3B1JKV1_ASTMX